MSNTSTMPLYRVNNAFKSSTDAAFMYGSLEKRFRKYHESYQERKQDIGGRLSPTWTIMSFVALAAAVLLGIYGAYNAQGAIAGVIDPMGTGVIPPFIILGIGAAISIVGMLLGHFIYEGFLEGLSRDPYTGVRSINLKIWKSIVGILGACFYIGFQYALVNSALEEAEIGKENGFSNMSYVVVGVAFFELLIGATMIHMAFSYLLLFATGFLLSLVTRRMNSSARVTNDNYRRYMDFLDAFNRENPSRPQEREGNINIRRAIAHYSGIEKPKEDENKEEVAQITTSAENANLHHQSEQQMPSTGTVASESDTNRVVQDFINDTTDQDLTV